MTWIKLIHTRFRKQNTYRWSIMLIGNIMLFVHDSMLAISTQKTCFTYYSVKKICMKATDMTTTLTPWRRAIVVTMPMYLFVYDLLLIIYQYQLRKRSLQYFWKTSRGNVFSVLKHVISAVGSNLQTEL